MWGHLALRDLHLNKLGKGPLHTKFQASKPNGSKAEDFFNIFLCISMV